jgi:proline racemase
MTRSTKLIHIVSVHAEGEVGDVVVGGVAPPPGDTLWDQRAWIASDQTLRNFVLNEPRGGVFRHVNLLVPAKHPDARFGFIIMEPEHTPPMSGSNSICVATALLDTGLVEMNEPETRFNIEAPAGSCARRGAVRKRQGTIHHRRNVPSFADKLDAPLEVEGHGTLTRRHSLWRRQLRHRGRRRTRLFHRAGRGPRPGKPRRATITAAANRQLGFTHPDNPDWNHISFCLFATPPVVNAGQLNRGMPAPSTPARSTDRPPAPVSQRAWPFCTPGGPCSKAMPTRPHPSSNRPSLAALKNWPTLAADQPSFPQSPAGPG